MYKQMIIEATGVAEEQAAEVEELMRLATGGTLDHLRRGEFDALAREANEARKVLA